MSATAQARLVAKPSRTTKPAAKVEAKPEPTPRSERRYRIEWRKDAKSPWRSYGTRSDRTLAIATVERRAPVTGREMRAIDTQQNGKVIAPAKLKAAAKAGK
jgi:hypothetical protein